MAVDIFRGVSMGAGRTFSKRDNVFFVNNTFWVNGLGFILVYRKTPLKLIRGVRGEEVSKVITLAIKQLRLSKQVYK